MGLLRKKDKRSKSSREGSVRGGDMVNQNATSYESKEPDNLDSALSGPTYSEPYSPTATDHSSMVSGGSQTTGPGQSKRQSREGRGPWFTSRQIRLFKKPPPAEQAAYSGPPRYDWVDIETSAAVKIQAAYRRKKVMQMMEEEGHTTAAVRNMARRRQAAKEAATNPAQDFIDLFNCCGVDLGLGGGNKESYWDYSKELETARYNETKREKAEREEFLRKSYKKRTPRESLVENVEVVEPRGQ